MIPVEIENARQKIADTIPTGAPMTVANDAIINSTSCYR